MLEEIDAQLVQQLQRDGRASYEALGRAVGLTRTAARARVSRLLSQGLIRVTALPDAGVAGQHLLAHVSAEVEGSARAAAHAIAAIPSATFVSAISGHYSVVAELRARDDTALAADLDHLRALPGVRAIDVVRAMLIVRDAYRPCRARPGLSLDQTDHVLISALQRDGRTPYSALATQARLSPAATRSRVLRLTRNGAVHITVLVDARATGRLARAGIGVNLTGPAQPVAEKIAGLPDIMFVMTGTGRYDLVAGADATSETALLQTIERIRAQNRVTRVQSWRHMHIIKESYAQVS